MTTPAASVRVAILGATGYGGLELLRWLTGHPAVEIVAVSSESSAGKPLTAVFPHLSGPNLTLLPAAEARHAGDAQVVFCALPNGEAMRLAPELLARVRRARVRLAEATTRVRELGDVRFRDFHARRLVEMAIDVVCGYLMLRAAQDDARKLLAAQYFVDAMAARVEGAAMMVLAGEPAALDALTQLGSL